MLKHLITRLEFYLIKIEDGFTCRATLVIEKLKIWKEFPSKMTWIIYDRMDEFNIIVVLYWIILKKVTIVIVNTHDNI